MAFPKTNPIDSGIFNKGAAIDHLGTIRMECRVCDETTQAEQFRVLVTGGFGFGAPYFIKPFLKRASTKGKVGKRAEFTQCCGCNSLWAIDENAKIFSSEMGWGPDGLICE